MRRVSFRATRVALGLLLRPRRRSVQPVDLLASGFDRRLLYQDLNTRPERIALRATLDANPEEIGQSIRAFLRVDDEAQKRAARQGKAFDFWRRRFEENDILVFVVSGPHWSVHPERNARLCDCKSRAARYRRQWPGLQSRWQGLHAPS